MSYEFSKIEMENEIKIEKKENEMKWFNGFNIYLIGWIVLRMKLSVSLKLMWQGEARWSNQNATPSQRGPMHGLITWKSMQTARGRIYGILEK